MKELESSIFYRPQDGWAGDFIPFFGAGRFHLFYLKAYRDEAGHGPGTPWFHITSPDLTGWTDRGEAIPRGTPDEQDLFVFTGSVMEKDGEFHIFYTGHNPGMKGPKEAICHATSGDLVRWRKDPENPILFADRRWYEPDDWRDPFIFWNEEAGEYWMLIAARLNEGPAPRRGCIALAASPDLLRWEVRGPFWAPHLYHTHECPDLFRWGEKWYLVYSTFSERMVTHYRMSESLQGPWRAPANDTFDSRAFYAAKTASDGQRRFAFGWNPTRADRKDDGNWQWGGNLVVHELLRHGDGRLLVRMPPEMESHLAGAMSWSLRPHLGRWDEAGRAVTGGAPDGFAWASLTGPAEDLYFCSEIRWTGGTRACGVLLRAADDLGSYYAVRIEPGRGRIVFDRWPRPGDRPFMLERPLELADGVAVRLRIVLAGSIVEIYADDRVALSARAYEHTSGSVALFVQEGEATFENVELRKLKA